MYGMVASRTVPGGGPGEAKLRDLFARFPAAGSPNESQTEEDLIWPVLRTLGWSTSLRQVTDTILHEIAHALAGPGAGHGPAWKATASRLGATPKSCAPESDEARRRREAAKANFRTGDTVSFLARGVVRTGVIVRMNPKRAKVKSGDVVWSVPYAKLSATHRLDRDPPEN